MSARLAAAGTALVILLAVTALAVAAGDPGEGKAIFEANCGGCHTIGGGDTVGPDLKDVLARSDEAAVRQFIEDPAKAISSGDPTIAAMVKKFNGIVMPKLGLTAAQVDAVVAYLGSQGEAAGGTTGKTGSTQATGDAAAGKRLYTGSTQLANGGPACISCHTIAGAGSLGGGQVGPDLTAAYEKFGGAAGVGPMLAALPFPTMAPIYADHPLTEQEQASLAAFLRSTSGEAPASDSAWAVAGLGLAVAAAFLLLAFAIWPRRRLVVRRRIAPIPTLTRRR